MALEWFHIARRAPTFAAGGARGGRRPAHVATLLLALVAAAPGCVLEPDATSCATGIYCPAGTKCAARDAVCIVNDCGDGVLEPGEVCDDGGVVDGDGCSASCKSAEVCGNGIVDEAVGEVCEPSLGRCREDCRSTLQCGNGLFDPGERCERTPGETLPTAICNVDCTESKHGDGIQNPKHVDAGAPKGEECDDGERAPDGTTSASCESRVDKSLGACNANCTSSVHGDGIANRFHKDGVAPNGELCDGGPTYPSEPTTCESEGCDLDCTPASCGDGTTNLNHFVEGTNGARREECDDGDADDEDDCRTGCRMPICGDEVVHRQPPFQNGPEEFCDLGARNGDGNCPYGETSCTGCTAPGSGVSGCTIVPSAQMTTHYCGDGNPEDLYGEDCDRASFACETCDRATCATIDEAAAKGTITVPFGKPAVADGDYLIFGDGLNAEVKVQFYRPQTDPADDTCQPAPGLQCVPFSNNSDEVDVASLIENVVDGWTAVPPPIPPAPTITVVGRTDNVVELQNIPAGYKGNIGIQRSPSTKITVVGMRDGAGCPLGGPDTCARHVDCVGGLGGNAVCSAGVCSPAP